MASLAATSGLSGGSGCSCAARRMSLALNVVMGALVRFLASFLALRFLRMSDMKRVASMASSLDAPSTQLMLGSLMVAPG